MLLYNEYKPTQKLAPFVECYWELKDSIPKYKILKECLIPGGRAEIIFTNSAIFWFGKDKLKKPVKHTNSFLLGQRNTVKYIGLSGDLFFIGIRFKHGCQALFKIHPVHNYTNKLTPLKDIYGSTGERLGETILNNKSINDSITLIENWLLSNLTATSPDWQLIQDYITRITSENFEDFSIKKLSEVYGWHYKKTERTFLRYTGYTPKNFIKLIRFKKLLEKDSSKHLTKKAYNSGFYDQSHFIREFYHYTGDKPSSFYKNPPRLATLLYKMKP